MTPRRFLILTFSVGAAAGLILGLPLGLWTSSARACASRIARRCRVPRRRATQCRLPWRRTR